MRYLFEDCALDIDKRELRRGADVISIAPQVFDLIEYLIRNREHVVSKDNLISTVWQGRIVSDAAVTTRLNAARSAIGDSGEEQRLIKTLPRKGFRFVGEVWEDHKIIVSRAEASTAAMVVQTITVLIVDMEGFRGLPERLGASTGAVMGEYFELVTREVRAYGGTVDRFVGDAVIAFWNAADHAANACRAAVASQLALQRSNLRDDIGWTLSARIGINSGSAVVGNIGSSIGSNHMVMGDAVNAAWVLEKANKRYGTKIIIGAETRRLAGECVKVRALDDLSVQGYSADLQIFELFGLSSDNWLPPNWLPLYEAGLDAYRARDFSAAIEHFQMLLYVNPSDTPSQLMLERCLLLLKAQPNDDSRNPT